MQRELSFAIGIPMEPNRKMRGYFSGHSGGNRNFYPFLNCFDQACFLYFLL